MRQIEKCQCEIVPKTKLYKAVKEKWYKSEHSSKMCRTFIVLYFHLSIDMQKCMLYNFVRAYIFVCHNKLGGLFNGNDG